MESLPQMSLSKVAFRDYYVSTSARLDIERSLRWPDNCKGHGQTSAKSDFDIHEFPILSIYYVFVIAILTYFSLEYEI